MKLDNVQLAVFDSVLRANFFPLTLTRATFDLHFGTRSLLGRVERRLGVRADYLFVPDYLKNVVKENHPSAKVNEHVSQKCVVINPLVSNNPELWKALEDVLTRNENTVIVDGSGKTVFALLDELKPEWLQTDFQKNKFPRRSVLAEEGSPALMNFPWKLIDENGSEVDRSYVSEDRAPSHLINGPEIIGDKLAVSPSAEIQRFVTLDSRNGPIIIEDNAYIESFSYLTGPCYIGENVVVKSARVGHGTSIANFSRIAGEIEQSIISEYSNKNHEGYVGHSFVGSWVNLGAFTTTSDLKNTYGEIKVTIGHKTVNTGSVKVGVFIGDMAKTGIGTTITCGKSIGVSSHALGSVQESVPSFTMHPGATGAGSVEIYIDSAIETQRRMMKRRGVTISSAYISMIRTLFKLTKGDRLGQHVSKGRFR
ncbi:MAG: hypothetical protein JRN15_04000 [Nitrososphaerota archaeon]|nr:hypothetical protein [Nitrososphaerota archaeon]